MNETTILLSGDPGARAEFLATVEPVALPRRQPPPFDLPFELTLDGYTREPWSSGRVAEGGDAASAQWQSCYLASTDGRNRLPGFVKYLRDRKKAAMSKFDSADGRAVLVVPYDPPPPPPGGLPDGVDPSNVIYVKYLRDERLLRGRGDEQAQRLKAEQQKKMAQTQQMQVQQKQQQQTIEQRKQQAKATQQPPQSRAPPSQPQPNAGKRKGGGLLGNLLGAQRRTENHLHTVRATKSSTDMDSFDPTAGAAGCINAFRTRVSADLERFKSDPTAFVTKISISLGQLVKAVPEGERDRVTMDVFKFAVYEQVEEVGMDKWIAAKEPSEFMDECEIAVYKEGHCPPDVLEDLNRGELPDEIKGQARHIVEAQSKAIQRKGKKLDEEVVKNSIVGEDNVVVLNTNKRDRRTLEQIQKDLQDESEDVKRSRFD